MKKLFSTLAILAAIAAAPFVYLWWKKRKSTGAMPNGAAPAPTPFQPAPPAPAPAAAPTPSDIQTAAQLIQGGASILSSIDSLSYTLFGGSGGDA